MEWTDEGMVLGARTHGESAVVLELFTRTHGRHMGLVRGGRSRRLQPVIQAGNTVDATWKARLDEQLGAYVVEPLVSRAARLIASRAGVAGIAHLVALARLMPERDPHPGLYEALVIVADALPDPIAGPLMVRLELEVLRELGFGLDLDSCAATGVRENLAYVSPKTGRAVSLAAGEPWKDRLFPLPSFLLGTGEAAPDDLASGFRLAGYFLAQHVWEPRGLPPPDAREAFLRAIT